MNYTEFQDYFFSNKLVNTQDIRLVFPEFDSRRLNEWKNKGYLTKVTNKNYIFSKIELNEEILMMIANRIYQPSYISMETALGYYGLIPEAVYQIISCTSKKSKKFDTELASFSYRSIKESYLFGYNLKKHNNMSYYIASPEKAILDFLYFNPHLRDEGDFEELRINQDLYFELTSEAKFEEYLSLMSNKRLFSRYKLFAEVIKNA